MSGEPQLYAVDAESKMSKPIEEVDFAQLGLQERRDIQEWVAGAPRILGEDLLIIGKEFSGFDRTNERLDLLAVDADGTLVVIELKRDDTGADAHWQAIKYASYLHRANVNDLVKMLADKEGISQEEASGQLLRHLDADDLSILNRDQRIILASHRFAPEVTSAALWLNEKAPGENLVTCIKLTPFKDASTGSLYVQATTIIPVPGVDDYVVGIGYGSRHASERGGNSFAANLKKAYSRNKADDITRFLREVGSRAVSDLPSNIKPDKKSRWAGGWPEWRYYHFWYKRPPWSNHGTSYRINLQPHDDGELVTAFVSFRHDQEGLQGHLSSLDLHPDQKTDQNGIVVDMGCNILDGDFAGTIAKTMRRFIEEITPRVHHFQDEANQEDG